MIASLVLVPALGGAAAFLLRGPRLRRALLVTVAAAHAAMAAACWIVPPGPALDGWLRLDAVGRLMLTAVSAVFLAAAPYAVAALRREPAGPRPDAEEEGVLFTNAPEAVFTGCLLLLLAAMTLAAVSQHFGMLWLAMESSTLATASLIYYHRHPRSLEAAWKYILIGSVGIALALLGTFFLATAASFAGGGPIPLVAGDLTARARELEPTWLKAAFLFLLVGYGTKMGLAPLHTWKPDAYSEAPAVVSALLSGALTNCAFLALLRVAQVCAAAGLGPFAGELLAGFGLLSMAVAAVFLLSQRDFKRLLAYSSVEQMGVLALGAGLGAAGIAGALLHALNNALIKPMLFLLAGNIRAAYGTRSADGVSGVLRRLPASGVLWVAGFVALAGLPPFGMFVSELTILRAALDQGHGVAAAAYLVLLAAAFIGTGAVVLPMAQGAPPADPAAPPARESALAVLPPALLGAAALLLGLHVPAFLREAIADAARALGGAP